MLDWHSDRVKMNLFEIGLKLSKVASTKAV